MRIRECLQGDFKRVGGGGGGGGGGDESHERITVGEGVSRRGEDH